MYYAIDEKQNRVSAKAAEKGGKYTCPICQKEVSLRSGDKLCYFAHTAGSPCIDMWNYNADKKIKDFIVEKCKGKPDAIISDILGEIHKIDFLIGKSAVYTPKNPVDAEEFDSRNKYFQSLGMRVIWVFNCETFDNSIVRLSDKNSYAWTNYIKALEGYDPQSSNAKVFLKINHSPGEYLLIKWISDNGPGRFCGISYDQTKFIEYISFGENEKNLQKIIPAYPLKELWQPEFKAIIAENLLTRTQIKITRDPSDMLKKYGRIFGRVKLYNQKYYTKDTEQIINAESPEWILKWHIRD